MRKRTRERLESAEAPTLVPSNQRWASKPRFIRAGSHLFDELFRLSLGMSLGFMVGSLATESWRSFGVGGLMTVVFLAFSVCALGFAISIPFGIVYAFARKPSLKHRRLPGQPPLPALRFVGRTTFVIGIVLWLATRDAFLGTMAG